MRERERESSPERGEGGGGVRSFFRLPRTVPAGRSWWWWRLVAHRPSARPTGRPPPARALGEASNDDDDGCDNRRIEAQHNSVSMRNDAMPRGAGALTSSR